MRFLCVLAPFLAAGLAGGLHAAPPAAPVDVTARAGTGVVGLNWSDVPEATQYRIYQAASAAGPFDRVAARNRSRHLVADVPAGTTRFFRVTAVNAAGEESVASATVPATADGRSLDRPAVTGHFRIGSSYVTDSDRLQRFLQARGLSVSSRRFQVIGAALEYMWTNTLATNPAALATEIAQLQSGNFDALVMNAQRPYSQGERELDGTLLFAEEALAARPDYRVFIHEYWSDEYLSATNIWAENLDGGNRARQQQWHWLSSVALAYRATEFLGVPVYVAPIGTAVDAAKTAAATGKLAGYLSRTDFHAGDSHLSPLGKYLQEGVVAAGAYQIDVRGTHRWVDGTTTLQPADATVLQQIIHDTVRNTPFSGWHAAAPTNLAGYLEAMRTALRIRESFEDFTATGSGSVTNPVSGLTWTFTGVGGYGDGFGGNSADYPVTRLDRRIRLNANGTLTTTLPRGLTAISARLRVVSSGPATLQVKANGTVVGTLSNASTTLYGREIRNLGLGGAITLELRNVGASPLELDDVIWDEPEVSPGGLAILNEDLGAFGLQQSASRQLTASGGSGSYAWSVTNGSLPAGLTLSAAGLLSGTPTAAGGSTYTVRVTDVTDPAKSGERTYTTTIVTPTAITSQPQPVSVPVGAAATFAVVATGTDLTYEWYRETTLVAAGASASYTISSVTTANAGRYSVRVIGAAGVVTSESAGLTVLTGINDTLTTSFAGGTNGEAGNTFDLRNTGANPLVLTGALQGNFNAVSGIVVRAYTRPGTANGFATSASGWTLWGTSEAFTGNGYGNATGFVLRANGAPATVTIPPGGTVGVYLLITNGGKQIAYTANATTYQQGNLLFTPQQGLGSARSGLTFGPFNTATFGPTRSWNGSLTFYEDTVPVIGRASVGAGRLGVAFTRTFAGSGGNGTPTFALSGSLPGGVTFDPATATLAGVPRVAGSFPLALTATDTDGDVDTFAFTWTVEDPFVTWLAAAGLPADTDPLRDPVGEGLPLRLRHALGMPALASARHLAPTVDFSGDAPAYALRYNPSATGLVVRVQASTDLVTWNDAYEFAPGGRREILAFPRSFVPNPDGTENIVLQLTPPDPATGRLFLRVQAEPAF